MTPSASYTRTLPLLSFGAFMSVLGLRATDPLLPMIADAFGILPGAASITITAFGMGYGGLQVVHGALGDRFGKFRLMAMLSAFAAVASLLCGLAPNLPSLIAARFAAGAMTGGLIPLSMAWIGDMVPYEKRQAAIARFLLGNFLGLSLGPLICGYAGEAFGWRMPFWLMAALYCLVALLLHLNARHDASKPAQASSIGAAFAAMPRLLKEPWIRNVLGSVVLSGAAVFAPFAFVPLHAQTHLGAGVGSSSWPMIAFGIGSAVFSLASAGVIRRLGERGMLLWGAVLLPACWLTVAATSSLPLALAAVFLVGPGTFFFHNTLQVHGTQMAPDARGASMALFAAALFVSQSLAIAVGGFVVDRWGTPPVFVFAALVSGTASLNFRRLLARRS